MLVFPLGEYCLLTNERVCVLITEFTMTKTALLPTLSRLAPFFDAHPSNNCRNVISRYVDVKSLDFPFIFLIDEFSLVEGTNYMNGVVK